MILVLRSAFNLLFQVLELFLIIDVVLSWVYRGSNKLTDIIHTFTEPFLAPGRKIQENLMPGSPLDLSPILGLAIIWLLRTIVMTILGML